MKEASEALGLWWYHDKKSIRSTVGSKSAQGFPDQCGDIGVARSGLANPWVWAVEVKNREDWSIEEVLEYGKDSVLVQAWLQCKRAIRDTHRFPLLWLKRAYHKPLVGLRAAHVSIFESRCDKLSPQLTLLDFGLVLMPARVLLSTKPGNWLQLWKDYAKLRRVA